MEAVETVETEQQYTEFAKQRNSGEYKAPAAVEQPSDKSESDKDESAAPTEAAKPTQEDKPKRDRSAEGRAKELIAEGRHDEAFDIIKAAERKRHEQELLKTGTRKPDPVTPPAAAPKPEAKVESSDKPKLADFVAKAGKDGLTYEDAQEQWSDAVEDWRDKRRETQKREADAKTHREEFERGIATRAAAAKAKYEDWDTATQGDSATGQGVIYSAPMLQYIAEEPDGFDVAYHLAKNPDEMTRIKGLSQARQIAELGKIGDSLNNTAPPEKPKPTPISRVPAPPRTMSGSEAPATKPLSESRDFEEFKKLRQAK